MTVDARAASDLAENAGPPYERIAAWLAMRLGGPVTLLVARAVAAGFREVR